MSEPLQRVLRADAAADACRRPDGLPAVARRRSCSRGARRPAKARRAVVIVADEAAMRALAETVPLFAPEVEVLTFPGWDCLPYDRASPALRVMAERLATLSALQAKRDKPQLLVATASAATQRVLTPFRIRQLTRRIAEGERIEREALIEPAERAWLPARRHRRRAWRICRARIADRSVSRPARSWRFGSISSATRSTASAASIPPISARPTRPKRSR